MPPTPITDRLCKNQVGIPTLIASHRQLEGALFEANRRLSDGARRWISVSERMPEDEQRVLGCWFGMRNGDLETLIYYAADAPDGPERWTDVWHEKRDEPTHWMPLPEAPKA